ncbi:HesA/MoeB/ThiF family protein [uncultured Psychrosphaera sp.]|uniref:HesA/MoeB/ThiF family protein n=1 Tax=uncultured Psychrosphaera sp. TaxID=1403522 RepID=UPI002613AAB8|nr:HesA/MoeB/ThiF family protein [uncultured Psychrosphaera sp.]
MAGSLSVNERLTDRQFMRYNRHIMADNIGEAGQLAITKAKVVIIGMGGLGCPASQYLAASGVGHITLIDHDIIETSNLQRQVLFTEQDIGKYKVDIARQRLKSLNPLIEIKAIKQSVFNTNLSELFDSTDIVLDCTDSAKTRHFINAAAVESKIKLVSASAIQGQGQLVSFDFTSHSSAKSPSTTSPSSPSAPSTNPCYQCLFPAGATQNLNCSTSGVFSPVLGVLGSLQATEALRLILGNTNNLNKLILFDAWGMEFKRFAINKDPQCKCCSQ